VKELLEMLALQADVLELKANPKARARGTVIESEMHKGLGSKATVLVQNGTLRKGDPLVFDEYWGRIKTMHNEYGDELDAAGPSTPVEITGLSGLPEAGQEFIVMKSEKEAKEISELRAQGIKQTNLLQKKKLSMEHILQQASESGKKILNLVIRADVQGSLEALKVALGKIESSKAEVNIIFTGVGEISESDVQLAAASKAVILGFHTQIESHADQLVKELGVIVKLHDIIYHMVDEVKLLMAGLLDKIAIETEKGKAFVKATFKSSHLGIIAGCQVTEGTIHRNNLVRVRRGKDVVFKGTIASLKKVKEDVREVSKGIECGILINNFSDPRENDIIEAYEITYLTQEL
jgi:translation initiation factor IF-2